MKKKKLKSLLLKVIKEKLSETFGQDCKEKEHHSHEHFHSNILFFLGSEIDITILNINNFQSQFLKISVYEMVLLLSL